MTRRSAKSINLPEYRKLSRKIASDIDTGKYKPGEKLPTENEMIEATGLSKGTVRAAYSDLAAKGIIVKRQGSGTYVADDALAVRKKYTEKKVGEFFDQCAASGMTPAEIYLLVEKECRSKSSASARMDVGLIDCTPEILSNIKFELEHETDFRVTTYLLNDVIDGSAHISPRHDLLITTSQHYDEVLRPASRLNIPLEKVELSVSNNTLAELLKISDESMIGIVYESQTFLTNISPILASAGKTSTYMLFPLENWRELISETADIDIVYIIPPELEHDNENGSEIISRIKASGSSYIRMEYRIDDGSLIRLRTHEVKTK